MALEKIRPRVVDAAGNYRFNDVTLTGNVSSPTANIANITGVDNLVANSTTITLSGSLTTTSNISAGNIKTNNLLYANGVAWSIGQGSTVSGANTQVQFNDASTFGASSNFTFNKDTNTLTVSKISGNGAALTSLTGGNVVGTVPNASYATTAGTATTATTAGTVTTNAQPNITSVGTLTTLDITGNLTSGNANLGNLTISNYFSGSGNGLSNIQGANVSGAVSYATTANNVAGSNVSGAVTYASTANAVAGANVLGSVANATYANTAGSTTTAGTVTTNAQPNITSVGTLTSLTITGNLTAGNANLGNAATANYFIGNGSLLTGIIAVSAGYISNGNSNVNIPSANGNVNISAVGNANVLVVTGTGANVTGTLNVSGDATVGNIVTGSGAGGNITGANWVIANYFSGAGSNLSNIQGSNVTGAVAYASTANSVAGANVSGQVANALVADTVTTAAQGNITSLGTLTGLTSNGIVNFTNASNVALGAVANVHITGGSLGQYLSTDGSGTLSWVTLSSSSTLANGNSRVNIPTLDGNVNISVSTSANVLVVTTTGVNIAGTLNATGNANVGNIGATRGVFTTVAGSLTTNAQPNITSVGTLTSLSVTGNVTAGNLIGSLANGNSNVSIPSANGNVNISAVGNANVLVVTGTGANITGTANVSGNLSAGNIIAGSGTGGNITGANVISANTITASGNVTAGNIKSDNLLYANGSPYIFTAAASGSNTQVQFNDSTVFAGSANFTFNKTTNTLSVTNLVGNGSGLTSLTGANVTGFVPNANVANTAYAVAGANVTGAVAFASTANSVAGANVSGQVGNALVAGTVYTAAQPNITSVGTLTSLSAGDTTITGNLTVSGSFEYANVTSFKVKDPIIEQGGNTAGGALTSNDGYDRGQLLHYYSGSSAVDAFMGWDNSNAEFAFGSNVTVSSEVTTFNSFGNVRANFFIGNGSQLTGVAAATATKTANGTSNVDIATANGNITMGVAGNASIVTVTGTGVNIAGYANLGGGNLLTTGNANVGNLGFGSGVITGTGNITSGNANLGNAVTANYFIGSGNNLSNIQGANVSGAVAYATTANAVAGANVSGAVAYATTANAVAGANVSGAVAYATTANAVAGANVSGQVANALIAGTVYTNAQPNITSIGTLTGLTIGNATANAVFGNGTIVLNSGLITGNGAGLSQLAGGNVTGQVANALIAGTVYTNAQPNITTVGTLTTLIVGNATANSTFGNGTITASGNISFTGANVSLGSAANLHINGGTAGYFLTTDGTGNLSWGSATGGGGVTASGSNTYIQFNDGGVLGSSANLAFDKSTKILTVDRAVHINGANLGSNVSNVYIGGGTANQFLKTDGSGNLTWASQSSQTVASTTVDTFTGDGTTTAFTLGVSPTNINQTVVNYNGAFQLRAAYTISGSTITFSSAPANGSLIEVTTTMFDNLNGSSTAFVTRSYTGTGSQTAFTVTSGCTVTNVIVTENGLVQAPTTDYTISGTTLTFTTAPGNGVKVQIRELGVAIATVSPSITWNIASSNITMVVNNGYFVDTSGGAKTMTLPASATLGDTIRINDLAGSFATNNLTVARNGLKIQGGTDDLLIDVNQSSFGLVYSNSTYGWKLMEM
jgi:hypothetical protein